MKKIKSFNEACKVLEIGNVIPDVSALPEKHQKAIIAHYKLIIITEALNFLNGKWAADWNNWEQYKYYPWFKVKASAKKPSGFGFSHSGYGYSITVTHVGSRLCFPTQELARYAGKNFEKLYVEYFLMV